MLDNLNEQMNDDNLCLGLVVLAEHTRVDTAIAQLKQHEAVTVGEPSGSRIPVSVFTRRGADRSLLAELESLEGVLKVEIAYAQTIEEDEV